MPGLTLRLPASWDFRPENHYYELINENLDESNYKFAIFTDPQMGKMDRDGDGVGLVWDEDVANVEKMCQQLDQVNDLG